MFEVCNYLVTCTNNNSGFIDLLRAGCRISIAKIAFLQNLDNTEVVTYLHTKVEYNTHTHTKSEQYSCLWKAKMNQHCLCLSLNKR